MSRKGFILVAAIFGAGFLLLALATRGYRKLGELLPSADPAEPPRRPSRRGSDGGPRSGTS